MSRTSTSNSEAPANGGAKAALPEFRGSETASDVPPVSRPWLRWLMVPLVLLAGEIAARTAVMLDWVETPSPLLNMHMDEKLETFEEDFVPLDEPGTRYMIMGSSISNTNIDPLRVSEALEEETGAPWVGYNGAIYAGRYSDILFLAEWYHERWPFDVIVMELNPFTLRPGRHEQLQERLEKPPQEHWLVEHSMLFQLRNQLTLYDREKSAVIRGLEALDQEGTIYGWTRTIMDFAVSPDDPHGSVSRYREIFVDPVTGQPLEPTWELLSDFRDWAAERGIPIVWIVQPRHPYLEDYLPDLYKHESWITVAEQIAAAPGNVLLDLKDLEQADFLEWHCWFDATHMDPGAAARYSEVLGARLAEVMEDLRARGQLEYREP